jgi:electron transport complex protein RnfA
MSFTDVLLIMFGVILVDNFIFSKFLGICPFLGVSDKPATALGMGMAVIFVITLSSGVTWVVYYLLLEPLGLEYLRTVAFILVIAVLVQFIEMFLRKFVPALYSAMGIYLPLITTNCAVLGTALLNIQNRYNFTTSVCFGFAAATGFTLAIVIFAGLRARMDEAEMPRAFRGFPITIIAAGLLAMAFAGFSGISFA